MFSVRKLVVITTLLYGITLVFAARATCSTFYYVPGFDNCSPPDTFILFAFFLMGVTPCIVLPLRRKVSTAIVWILYLTHVLSAAILMPFFTYVTAAHFFFTAFMVFSFIITIQLSSKISLNIPSVNLNSGVVFLSVAISCIAAFVYINSYFPFTLEIPSIYDVYGQRAAYKETLASSRAVLIGYVIIIAGYSISPLAIICAYLQFQKKSIFLSVLFISLAVMLSMIIFTSSAFKSVAFSFVIVIPFVFLLNKQGQEIERFISMFLVVFLVILLFGIFFADNVLYIHWFRRVFIAPGQNVVYYFDYIGFWNMDGLPNAPNVISQQFYSTNGSANSGVYGAGLALGGGLGIIISLCILTVILVLSDAVSKGIPLNISISVLIPAAYALSNSKPSTVILTYGMLSTWIFLYAFQKSFFQQAAQQRGKNQ